jgi:tRNA-dihydrouridine synthase 1
MLVRRHGCNLCYSPMLPAKAFLRLPADGPAIEPKTGGPASQAAYFTTCETDRPLLAQLGGSDPVEMLQAARIIEDHGGVDGIDVNFGCPQQCAQSGGYGAFLLTEPERARAIIETLVGGLRVPVTAKMRIFADVADTVAFARMLEEAGVAAVAVHGRRREQRHHEGPADWTAIAAVKAALRIPVISNGSIRSKADVDRCLSTTGVDCVMSAKALLSNPKVFAAGSGDGDTGGGFTADDYGPMTWHARAENALEYLECCKEHPDGALPRMISDHLVEMLGTKLLELPFNAELRRELKAHRTTTSPQQFASLVRRIKANGAFYLEQLKKSPKKE